MHEERAVRIGREIFLAAFGLPLDSMDSWVIDRITSILEECYFRAGQKVFSAGEPLESVYFMQDGQILFTRDGGPSWTLKGRWVIGALEVLSDRPASHTATAVEDFYGMRVSAAAWVEMLEDSSQLARSAVVNASRAVTLLEERVPTWQRMPPDGTSLVSIAPSRAMTLVERLALLLDVRMLRFAGVQALADLAAVSAEVFFATGEVVVERGVDHERVIRIVEGEALAQREGPSVVRHQGPGDLVCGIAILGRVAGAWEARAVAPTRGISFPIETVFDLMEEHFDLVRSILSALGARREQLLERMATESPNLVVT
jgi:CRP-like cAMP-binding protein